MARFVYYRENEQSEAEYVGTVTKAKKLIKEKGGTAWIEHCDRDGCVFETTEVVVGEKNSGFRYNRHL